MNNINSKVHILIKPIVNQQTENVVMMDISNSQSIAQNDILN